MKFAALNEDASRMKFASLNVLAALEVNLAALGEWKVNLAALVVNRR